MVMKNLQIIVMCIITLGFFQLSHAGDKIKLHLIQPPPNKLGAGDLWKLDITNSTRENIKIYLTGTASESQKGLIVTGKSKIISVAPGTKRYTYEDFKSGEVSWKNKSVQESIVRTGSVPEGEYTICVTTFYENNEVADQESCIEQTVKQTGNISLISPEDGAEIDPGMPLVFTWTPLQGVTSYDLKIAEIRGDQSPDAAMKENHAFFEQKDIPTTTFQYPISAPKMENGKKYAWMVKSGGVESEVYKFSGLNTTLEINGLSLTLTPTGNCGDTCCCYKITVNNTSGGAWNCFQIDLYDPSYNNVNVHVPVPFITQTSPNGIMVNPGAPPTQEYSIWKTTSGSGTPFTSPSQYVGDICMKKFTHSYKLRIFWSSDGGATWHSPGDTLTVNPGNCLTDTCHADSIIINTGYNHNNGTLYSNGSFDNYWIVVADPDASTTETRPANVTGWLSNWNSSLNSVANWINYHPVAANGDVVSYDLRYRFCLDSNFQNVQIDMQMLVDDEADILVNGTIAASTPAQPSSCGDCNHVNIRTFLINTQTLFHPGCNEIILRVRNVHGIQTGVIVSGTVKATSGLRKISAECCPCTGPTGSINGFKWNDLNGDGIWQSNEPKLPNWTINLSNGQSVQTDSWGYYFFSSLPAGTYTVTETNQTGCVQTFPANGSYSVQLGYNETVNNINFGNKCDSTTSSICDSLSATVSAYQGQGNCCWQINLSHPQNTTGIKGIQFLSLSPNTFTGASLGSGYTSGWVYNVNSSTEFKIMRQSMSGYVPPGQLNGFFRFCLNNLSSPQFVVVNWLSDSDTIICSDTVTVNCDIPCVSYTKDTVVCNGSNYNWIYSFTNNSNFPISSVSYTVQPPTGAVITPTATTLSNPVGTGGNSGNITLGLSGVAQNTNVCVVMKFLSADGCCWCYDTLCVIIPSCICDKVDASVTGDQYSCCYNLSLTNNYAANYFTQVNFTCITPGVTLSTFSFTGSWGSLNYFPSNHVEVYESSGHIPMGTFSNIGNLCFTGYVTTPQYILVEWIRIDSVKCVDTLITNCVPPEPKHDSCSQIINDTIICLPNGTFQYTFQVQNNSTHTTTGFGLNPISPPGLTLNPNNFTPVNISPNGGVSAPQTLIISGINQNSSFCFEIALYEHVGNTYSWCCHSDTVCLTTPSCDSHDTCTIHIIGSPNQGDTLCKGQPVTIHWTGTTSNGLVNLYLIDVTHWITYQSIALNIPSTGSYNWTIPNNIPCDSIRRWQFYISDPNHPLTCYNYGPEFYIKCCDTLPHHGDSCTLQMLGSPNQGDTLCKGAPVTIHWSGYAPSGSVNIKLHGLNNNSWIGVTWSIPNTGSYNWTIPSNIACDSVRRWQFYVEDSQSSVTCQSGGPVFYIKCCDSVTHHGDTCMYGVNITSVTCRTPGINPQYDIQVTVNNMSGSASTLSWVTANNGNMSCSPVTLTTGINNLSCVFTRNSPPANTSCFNFEIMKGLDTCFYNICRDLPQCGNNGDSCDCITGNKISGSITYTNNGANITNDISCGATYKVDLGSNVVFNPSYTCSANCSPQYSYQLVGGYMHQLQQAPIIVPFIMYTDLYIYSWCGGKKCDSCLIKLDTLKKHTTICPKFEVSPYSIQCHNIFYGGSYDFTIAVTNFELSAGNINLTSMTAGVTLNSYSPTTVNPLTSGLISGNVTGPGTSVCIKVSFSIGHGLSCDTTICLTLPMCGLHINDTTGISTIRNIKVKSGGKFYLIGTDNVEVINTDFTVCYCTGDPLTAVPCDMLKEYCTSEGERFDPEDPLWKTETGRKTWDDINVQLEKMGLKLRLKEKSNRIK
jgi:hypothetical protein